MYVIFFNLFNVIFSSHRITARQSEGQNFSLTENFLKNFKTSLKYKICLAFPKL